MNKMRESDSIFLSIEYKMVSDVPNYEPDRYVNRYSVKVFASNLDADTNLEIGRGVVKLILESLALDDQYSMYDVFDSSHATMELGSEIYDFDEWQIKDEIRICPGYDIINQNILFLERLELAKDYRGHGIGKKIIRDILERFFSSAGLIALKAYPLQFESSRGSDETWAKKVALEGLEEDEEKARYKLYHYYQNLGFENLLRNEFFFMNPAKKNKIFEKLFLDDR